MYYTKSYKLGHPNPQMARKKFKNLDGKWDFMFDQNNIGLHEKWFKKFPTNSLTIEVPYTYQSKKGLDISTQKTDIIWYHREFHLTEISEAIKLVILGCDYHYDAYINGILVSSHDGGYDSSSIDITYALQAGENHITFRVEDSLKKDQIRGKQTSKDQPYSCFYEGVTGLYKSVYLEFLSQNHLNSLRIDGSYLNKTLSLVGTLSANNNNIITIELYDTNKLITKYEEKLLQNDFHIELTNLLVKPWCHENPKIYDIIITLTDENKQIIDQIYSYVGFRDFLSKNGHIYVNGKDTYFKGILYQGYFPLGFYTGTEREYKEDIELILKAGFNMARVHQKIEDPKFFYFADMNGLYCTLEIPSAQEFSTHYTKQYIKEVDQILIDNYNHPSIFCLVLFNESWGITPISDKTIQEFIQSCYLKYKQEYPRLFICSNDGWEHLKSDICSIHNYESSGEEFLKFASQEYSLLFSKQNALANKANYVIYSSNNKYQNEPIFLSEFGGFGLNVNKDKNSWSYEDTNNKEEYYQKIQNMYLALKDIDYIRGICFTQFSDVYPEMNGLFTIDRVSKLPLSTIKKLNDLLK